MLVAYRSETDKIRPVIQRFLKGSIIDIGCGTDKVTPDAFGVDCRELPGVNLVTKFDNNLSNQVPGRYDVVFSSHCLEHLPDDVAALRDWINLIAPRGFLILYLPDIRYYREFNMEHLQSYSYEEFIRKMRANFPELKEVSSGLDVGGQERYSFFCVFRRN